MVKIKSVTSPNVSHDESNFLTEIFFVNKYGKFPSYAWRKGKVLAQEWPKIVAIFRKLLKVHKIEAEQLAWYLYKYEVKEINPSQFGLMIWKIRRLFDRMKLGDLQKIYADKYVSCKLNIEADYAANNNIDQNNSLKDILSKLENKIHG